MMMKFVMGCLALDLGVSVREFGSRDGDPISRVQGEINLHAVKLILSGWIHVNHRVFTDVLLQDHRLSGCVVTGHLKPISPPVNEDAHGEKHHHHQQDGRQDPGCRLVDEIHLHLGRPLH